MLFPVDIVPYCRCGRMEMLRRCASRRKRCHLQSREAVHCVIYGLSRSEEPREIWGSPIVGVESVEPENSELDWLPSLGAFRTFLATLSSGCTHSRNGSFC